MLRSLQLHNDTKWQRYMFNVTGSFARRSSASEPCNKSCIHYEFQWAFCSRFQITAECVDKAEFLQLLRPLEGIGYYASVKVDNVSTVHWR